MIKYKYFLALCSFSLMSLMLAEKANAMEFFDSIRVCMFSEIEGVITKDGVPVVGAEVEQIADHRGKVKTRKVTTDSEGRFHFSPLYAWSLMGIMFDVLTFQEITIRYDGEEIEAWSTVKHGGGYLSEMGAEVKDRQKNLKVSCELSDEDTRKVIRTTNSGFHNIWGRCRWEGDTVVDHNEYPAELLEERSGNN